MRSLLLAVAVTACASDPPPPSSSPATRERAPDPAVVQANAQLADIQAAEQRARDEQQRQMNELEERGKAQLAAAVAKQKAEAEAQRKSCEDSRPNRVTQVKLAVAARLQAEARVLTIAKAVRASCKLGTKPTGSARISRSGSGWRVDPELQSTVTCSSLPKGATKDDAYVVLWRAQNGDSVAATGRILEPEDLTAEDRACEAHDKAAGLDFDAIRYEDPTSIDVLKKF